MRMKRVSMQARVQWNCCVGKLPCEPGGEWRRRVRAARKQAKEAVRAVVKELGE